MRRQNNHILIDATYTEQIELLPRYFYPWELKVNVDVLTLVLQEATYAAYRFSALPDATSRVRRGRVDAAHAVRPRAACAASALRRLRLGGARAVSRIFSSRSRCSCSRTNSSVLRSDAIVDSSVVSTSRRFIFMPSISRCTSSRRACVFCSSRSERPSASRTICRACASAFVADVVGHALRGDQRVAQVALVLAMLVEQRFHLRDFLAQAIDLAQRVFVVVGDFGDEREHFGA